MKNNRTRPIFRWAALFIFLLIPSGEARAQGPKAQEPSPVSVADLDKILQLLENPEEAKKLAFQLKTLVEARKQLLEKEKTEREGQAPEVGSSFLGLEKLYGLYEERIITAINELISGIQRIPHRLKQLRNYISREENFQEMKSIAMQSPISLLGGLGVWCFSAV